jgi:GNAT superfamily N-acetyltransferase
MDADNQASLTIEPLSQANFEKVLPLIAAYQRFYGMTPDEAQNRSFFCRFIDDQTQGAIFVGFEQDGTPIGFATLYFVPSSLSARISCTFNDLYTVPDVRGKGYAVMLGLHALVHARDRGHKKVHWLTQPSNKIAQQIYDYTNAERSEWLMYDLPVAY